MATKAERFLLLDPPALCNLPIFPTPNVGMGHGMEGPGDGDAVMYFSFVKPPGLFATFSNILPQGPQSLPHTRFSRTHCWRAQFTRIKRIRQRSILEKTFAPPVATFSGYPCAVPLWSRRRTPMCSCGKAWNLLKRRIIGWHMLRWYRRTSVGSCKDHTKVL